jgi:hypothetical protein
MTAHAANTATFTTTTATTSVNTPTDSVEFEMFAHSNSLIDRQMLINIKCVSQQTVVKLTTIIFRGSFLDLKETKKSYDKMPLHALVSSKMLLNSRYVVTSHI